MQNEQYSYGNFTGQDLSARPAAEFDGEIMGSCFSQPQTFSRGDPLRDVFPAEMTGTFVRCNLDNCRIPPRASVQGGCNRRLARQNDLEMWLVDENGNPTEPTNPQGFDQHGLSKLPGNIPGTRRTRRRIEELEEVVVARELRDAAQAEFVRIQKLHGV